MHNVDPSLPAAVLAKFRSRRHQFWTVVDFDDVGVSDDRQAIVVQCRRADKPDQRLELAVDLAECEGQTRGFFLAELFDDVMELLDSESGSRELDALGPGRHRVKRLSGAPALLIGDA